jgi:hypothetical protein
MRAIKLSALILVIAVGSVSRGTAKEKPSKALAPVSADEISIYKAVLQQFSSKEAVILHISATSYPLQPDSPVTGLSDFDCLKGIKLENLVEATHSYHDLPPDVLVRKGMTLVDPNRQSKIVHSNDPSNAIRERQNRGQRSSGCVRERSIFYVRDRIRQGTPFCTC